VPDRSLHIANVRSGRVPFGKRTGKKPTPAVIGSAVPERAVADIVRTFDPLRCLVALRSRLPIPPTLFASQVSSPERPATNQNRIGKTYSRLNSRSVLSSVQQLRLHFQRRSDSAASAATDPQPPLLKISFLRHFERSCFARQYGVRFCCQLTFKAPTRPAVVLAVKRPVIQRHEKDAEIATRPLRQHDLNIFGKATASAITLRFTDQVWGAILRSYSDHGIRSAEDRNILRAAQVIRGSGDPRL